MTQTLVTEIAYFPPISMLAAANKSDEWLLEAHENYQKGSFRNRCYLIGPHGPILLSVPLKKGKNQQQNIQEVEISYDEDWPTQHWRTIKTCYGSSAYLLYYEDRLHELLESRPDKLIDLCRQTLEMLLDLLNVSIQINYTKDWISIYNDNYKDLRNKFLPKAKLSSEERDIESSISGYQQIFPTVLSTSKISALDLLFNMGPEASNYLK